MSKELENRADFMTDLDKDIEIFKETPVGNVLRKAAAKLKAGRERIEALKKESQLRFDRMSFEAQGHAEYRVKFDDAEAARDKALADVERLRKLLDTVRERCLFADDDGGIGVSEDVHIDAALFDKMCAALKETKP